MQSMISNGDVSIAMKGKTAFSMPWLVPLLFVTNYDLGYIDHSQVSR